VSEKTPEQLFRRGLAHLNGANPAAAAAHFDAAMRAERTSGVGVKRPKYLSFYGLSLAAAYGPTHECLRACQRAAASDPLDADLQLNLGRVYLMAKKRTRALAAFERGLKLDPDHRGLLKIMAKAERRRPPVIAGLGRDHAINRSLGRLRSSFRPRQG
jgi:tetratricopeptide (TPR) repeat protein